jgi:hypothetical protein
MGRHGEECAARDHGEEKFFQSRYPLINIKVEKIRLARTAHANVMPRSYIIEINISIYTQSRSFIGLCKIFRQIAVTAAGPRPQMP